MKNSLKVVAFVLGLFAFIFVAELFGLGMFAFFEPKKENVRREVFENTKSYVHGKIQDLAKYYKEYTEGDTEKKETISALIRMQFAEFDETKIDNYQLRVFLTKVRGY